MLKVDVGVEFGVRDIGKSCNIGPVDLLYGEGAILTHLLNGVFMFPLPDYLW